MNTEILNYIAVGMGLVSIGLSFYAFWVMRGLNTLRETFFKGSSARDLESIINQLEEGLTTLQQNQTILEKRILDLRTDWGLSVQKWAMVRFNPFEDGGGNFSFCLALLDGSNSGVVITSMHGRQQNRIYAKKIENGKSENELTEEELEAVKIANAKHEIGLSKNINKTAKTSKAN